MERGAGKQHLGDADKKLYYIKRRTSIEPNTKTIDAGPTISRHDHRNLDGDGHEKH
ncbi:hypothetical protein TorRG33x02_338310 [Trema orientale]|uniref:Uncharacterized protein n=1 Tax=Trema orientale TaxID=63057 RepID=A0A2P5AXT3_TREOI|nr:hypothetical protein TorRG33x02_338310 [Trema orientale]